MNFRNFLKVYPVLVFGMALWGLTFIWYKQLYPFFSPISIVTLRLVAAVIILFVIAFSFKQFQIAKKSDLGKFLLLALFEPLIYSLGESFGVKYISSTLASLIIAIIPLVVPIASWFIFREKLRIENYIGIVISVIGVFFVIHNDEGNSGSNMKGILLMLLAVFSTVGFSVYVRILSEKYNPLTIVVYQNFIGLLLFLPLFFIFDSSTFFKSFHTIPLNSYLPVVYLSFFGSVLAFIIFVYAMKVIGISRANVFANLIPVFTALFAFIYLGEKFNFGKIAGMVIVISGVVLSQAGSVVNRRINRAKKAR